MSQSQKIGTESQEYQKLDWRQHKGKLKPALWVLISVALACSTYSLGHSRSSKSSHELQSKLDQLRTENSNLLTDTAAEIIPLGPIASEENDSEDEAA